MGKFNFDIDEAAILKAYHISSLDPTRWEDIDHELGDSIAGAITSSPGAAESELADPLGLNLRGIDVKDLDLESKAAVLISSKSFDPKAFLSAVHPNATYQGLALGTNHLRKVLDSRSEAIRILVGDNFDHFVSVKASTDALYTDMQEGVLTPENEYGSKMIHDKLKQAGQKADQVFLPILENASKAQRVRSTLGVFERSKFFFNLPGSLVESIEAGRFEAALRDYNKGKILLDSRPDQLVSGGIVSGSGSLEPQHKRIVEKVWGAVEKVMAEMRNLLINQLTDPSRSVEDQVKTIEIILEMNTSDDPVWIYFDSQHQYILNHMRDSHQVCLTRIQDARDEVSDSSDSVAASAKDVQTLISGLGTPSMDGVVAKGAGSEVWIAILAMVKNISEVILTSLPPFWKIAKDYMDGRFKKNIGGPSSSRRSPQQCRTMALDIVKLYISLLSEFFTLSDKAVVSLSSATSTGGIPPFVPSTSNSITTAYYVSKILSEINECVNDVTTAELAGDASSGLRSLLESARWRFEDAMCETWLQDAAKLHHLETWELDPDRPAITVYLSHLHKFQTHAATSAYKIAGGIDIASSRPTAKQIPIGRDFAVKIQKAFIDSVYSLLDGLEVLSRADYVPSSSVVEKAAAGLTPLDISKHDTRLLLMTSSFGHMSKSIIPGMLNQLESALGVTIGQERITLMEVVEVLDKTLFGDYIKDKSAKLSSIIRRGVLDSGIDWYETPRPTEVREYMYEALLYLVGIHSQVTVVAKNLLERTMNALVEDVANEALACFQQVKKFGMGGMLRATLEIEFMHQTLVQYVSPTASDTLTAIYGTISAAYSRKSTGNQQDNLQRELDGVKRTLHESRRSTAIEFLCFKPTKDTNLKTSR